MDRRGGGVDAADGIERAVGIVMAPHRSGMSVPTSVDVEAAPAGAEPAFSCVRDFHVHPGYIALLADRVRAALASLPDPDGATVTLSVHSPPTRTLDDASQRCMRCAADECLPSCRYHDGLRETADLVAAAVGLERSATAWQSAGRTADPWWGPPVENVTAALAGEGCPAVLVCSAGFVADHLEILFDLDIEARGVAQRAGTAFARTEMPNDDPAFTAMLADVVLEHVQEHAAS